MKNKVNKKTALILLIFAILGIAVVIIFVVLMPKTPRGYERVEGFHYDDSRHVHCQAISKECGYCPGKIVHESCYVKKGEPTN